MCRAARSGRPAFCQPGSRPTATTLRSPRTARELCGADAAEVRVVSITNLGSRAREVELTSYSEIVLATEASDTAHPAFSKMFVQTEFDANAGAILATRRLRSPNEVPVWAAHLAVAEGESVGEIQFETDRARFLGRGRDVCDAVSVIDGRPLSDTVGTVLDPIFSVRRRAAN